MLWVAPSGHAEAARVLAAFLDGLTQGEVRVDLLEEQSRERLRRSLDYHAGHLPVRYRIGELREAADGEILANVRLFGRPGVTEGEAYLVRSDAGWRVGDLQLALALLQESYVPDAEPFVPSTYEYRREPSEDE